LPIRHPWWVVGAFVLITIAAAIGVKRLREEDNLLVFLPTDDPDVQLFTKVNQRFGGMRVAMVGVEAPPGKDVFSSEVLKKIDAATTAFAKTRDVSRVLSLTNVTDVVATSAGAQARTLVDKIPSTAEEERALRELTMTREHLVGNLVSADGRAALIMVFLEESGSDSAVTRALRAASREHLAPLATYFGGAPFYGRAIYEEAQEDVWWTSPLAVAVLLLVVVLSFRDPVAVVLSIASVAIAILVVIGGMGWAGDKFTVATSTLPVILFASGSSYAINVLGRYYLLRATQDGKSAITESLRIVGPPLLIAACTTSAGFFSFVATDVRPMRAFGIACGAGVLLCWLFAVTLVPAIITLVPRKAQSERRLDLIGDWLVALWNGARRRRWLVLAMAAVTTAALVRPMTRVKVRMDPSAFFREGSEPMRAEKFLETRFGGAHFIQVALEGDLDDPLVLRELQRLEDFLGSLPGVAQVSSILGPLRLASDAMGNAKRLPTTPAQASNLYFFLESETGVSSLMAEGRKEALIQIRIRGGEAAATLEAIEKFCSTRLRTKLAPPTVEDITDRVAWTVQAIARRPVVDRARLANALSIMALPGDGDREWSARRDEVALAFLKSEEAPPLDDAKRDELLTKIRSGGAWQEALKAAAPSPEEGELAVKALTQRLTDERLTIAVNRALPIVLEATGVGFAPAQAADEARLRKKLALVLDDLFTYRDAPAPAPGSAPTLQAKVAGEPVLDRGFSRSVERTQWTSLAIAIVVVLALMTGLFRSLRMGVASMAASMFTLVVLFGVMGLLGLHIDLGTSLVAGIATGAGSDFAMNYLWYLRRQSADEVSRSFGPVMVVSILLVSLGFVVLALGKSPVMRLFGTLAGAAMSLSAFFTVLLVPALLNKVGAGPDPTEQTETSPRGE
jgi:predicted RND superfamily exporter protein